MMYIAEMMKSFHCLPACDRIDLICRILRHCTYYEVKFVGYVMADVSLSQVKENPALEGNANRLNYYAMFKETGLTHEVCEKLCHALALLHPDNRPVAEVVFNLLDDSRILTSFRDATDLSVLDDYRLLYMMAVNHPVLSFGQRHHLMYTYLQAMDVLYSAKVKADSEVTSSSPMEVEKTDNTSGNRETVLSLETVPFPEALPDAYVTRVEVHGVYKRPIDKRFNYIIQVEWSDSTSYAIRRTYGDFFTFQNKLLDLFPEESGQKNKKQRIIPFLPGKKIITNKSSRELAEKRLPELAKYAKELVMLPSYMLHSAHVLEFFKPRTCDSMEAFPPLHKITNLQDLQQEPGKVRQSSESTWPSPSSGQDSPPRSEIGLERLSKTLPFTATASSAAASNANTKPSDSPLERRFTYPARQAKLNGLAPPIENTLPQQLYASVDGVAMSPHDTSERSRSPPSPLSDKQGTVVHSTTNIPSQPLSPTRTLTPVQDTLGASHSHILSGSSLRLPQSPPSSISMPDLSTDRPTNGGYSPHSSASSGLTTNSLLAANCPGAGSNDPRHTASMPLSVALQNASATTPLSTSALGSLPPYRGVSLPHLPHPLHAGPAHTTAAMQSHMSSDLSVTATSSSLSMAAPLPVPTAIPTATLSSHSTAMPSSHSHDSHVSSFADTPPAVQPGGVTSPQDSSQCEILHSQGLLHHMGSSSSIPNISSFSYGSPLPSPVTSSPNTPYLMGSTSSVAQDCDSLPKWLKRHRLHKYAMIFNGMTFEEMQLLTEDNLKEKGMTAGAAKKLRLKLDELGQFNFSGFQQASMKASTCSLPASLLAERGLTHSSSCDRLTPYGSTSSLDQANETTSLVVLPSSAPNHHHHHHRRAGSLGVIPVLTDTAIVKVVQRDALQEASEGGALTSLGCRNDYHVPSTTAGDATVSAVNPDTSHSSQDSGISRTSVSVESTSSWADQSSKGTGEGDMCLLPTWAQLHRSSPNITFSAADSPLSGSPVLSHSCLPPPPAPLLHQSHPGNHHTPSPHHTTFSPTLGGRHHTPVHKRHSSDSPSTDTVHPVSIQLIHQMAHTPPPPPPHAHLPFNGNSWQAMRPIIIPGAMQLQRGGPRGPILTNGLMTCTGPMQRIPIVFMSHTPLSHGRTTQNMTCFNCGKKGHLGNSCPNGNVNSSPQAFHHDASRTRQSTTTTKEQSH